MRTLNKKRFEVGFAYGEERCVGKEYYISTSKMLDDKPGMNGLGLFFKGIYEKDLIGVTHAGAMMSGQDVEFIDDYHLGKAADLYEQGNYYTKPGESK